MINWLTLSPAVAVGLFAAWYFKCARKISAVNDEINRLLDELRTFDAESAFAKAERLSVAWKDFSASLTRTPEGTFATASASEFFSPQNLTRGLNMSFWQAYGGIFTGLGILGTFLGLTNGLRGLDMTSGDVEILKGGIVNLLSGVETAFVTSLVGIFGALLYSVFHHALIKNFRQNLLRLGEKLDEIFPRRPAEDWLSKSFAEQQIHTATLQKFVDVMNKFTSGGVDKVGEVFTQRVGSQLDRFAATLDKFSAAVDKRIEDAQKVSDDMNKQLLSTLGGLSETLKRQTELSAADRQAAAKNFSDTANHLTEALTRITADNTAQISDAVKAFREIVDRHNETTKKTFDRIQRLLDESETFLLAVNNAGTSLERSSETLRQTADKLLAQLPELAAQMKNLLDANRNVRENIFDLSAQLTTLVRNFNGLGDEFERSATVIKDSLEHYNSVTNEGLGKKLQLFDKSMSQAVGHLRELIEDLNDALADFNQNRRR